MEVGHAAAKALRFGLDDFGPNSEHSNRGQIILELNDLIAVAELLKEEGLVDFTPNRRAIAVKKAKVRRYLELSKKLGTLKAD